MKWKFSALNLAVHTQITRFENINYVNFCYSPSFG